MSSFIIFIIEFVIGLIIGVSIGLIIHVANEYELARKVKECFVNNKWVKIITSVLIFISKFKWAQKAIDVFKKKIIFVILL